MKDDLLAFAKEVKEMNAGAVFNTHYDNTMEISTGLALISNIQKQSDNVLTLDKIAKTSQAVAGLVKMNNQVALFAQEAALIKLANDSMVRQRDSMKKMRDSLDSIRRFENFISGIAVAPDSFAKLQGFLKTIDPSKVQTAYLKTFDDYFPESRFLPIEIKQSRICKNSHQNNGIIQVEYDLSLVTTLSENNAQKITPAYINKEAKNVKRIIQDIYRSNAHIFKITPRQFEEVIAELLIKRGFKVELTQQTRDGGKDIIAISYDNAQSELKHLVECKRKGKGNPVGVDIIRSFCYTVDKEKANKGMIFTTSSFSSEAFKERDTFGRHRLDLRDYSNIIQWVTDYITGFSTYSI